MKLVALRQNCWSTLTYNYAGISETLSRKEESGSLQVASYNLASTDFAFLHLSH